MNLAFAALVLLPLTPGLSTPLSAARVPVAARWESAWNLSSGGHALAPIALDSHPAGLTCILEGLRRQLLLTDSLGRGLRPAARADAGTGGFPSRVFARSGLQIFTLDGWNRRLDRYDLAGHHEGYVDLARGLTDAGETIGELSDFAVDPGGEFFVLEALRGRVLHCDARGRLRGIIGASGEVLLQTPAAIDVDARGRLYLLETRPPALLVLDADGRPVRRTALGKRPDLSRGAGVLAVDAWGNAFMAAEGGDSVLVLPGENLAASWWIEFPPEESPGAIADLAIAAAGRLLVADPQRERVSMLALQYRDAGDSAGDSSAAGDRPDAR